MYKKVEKGWTLLDMPTNMSWQIIDVVFIHAYYASYSCKSLYLLIWKLLFNLDVTGIYTRNIILHKSTYKFLF